MRDKPLKTADGVVFTPDMKLFYNIKGVGIVQSTGVCRLYVNSEEPSLNIVEFYYPASGRHIPIVQCYSSKEALEAAEND